MSKQCKHCTDNYNSKVDGLCKYCRWEYYRYNLAKGYKKSDGLTLADAEKELKKPRNQYVTLRKITEQG